LATRFVVHVGGEIVLRRFLTTLAVVAAFIGLPATAAFAGSPHFVDSTVSATQDGNTLTVSGKEAGLGDEPQVHIVVTATAECINPGDQHPQAGNKETVSAAGDFPVQNGKAEFSLSVTAVFQPSCSPPMTVAFTDIVVTDETSGISASL